ncbi:MAG: hypothetical protein JOZ70_05370 [Pseudolabrys sp.]|nr:hypothetical protein [Pseudolabrys sp.]MBV9954662.1 hypothetical protein [Pseudolabrys sp.]
MNRILHQTLGAAAIAAALGACSTQSGNETVGRALVPASNYDLYDCRQLETQLAALTKRARELEKLKSRAAQGPAGGLLSSMSYEPEYLATETKMGDVRNVMAERKCPPAPAPGRSAGAIR